MARLAAVPVAVILTVAAPAAHRIASGENWRPKQRIDAPGVNGVVLLSGSVRGARIGPARITGAYRAVETEGRGAVLKDIRIEGLRATNLERDGIRLRGDIDGATIADFTIRMRARPQTGPHLPQGISILSGTNIRIRDGRVTGFRMAYVKGRYPNGDGISAERPVHGLVLERIEASDNSDAGFDLKSSATRLDDLVAMGNLRNYRFWAEVNAGTLTSINPRSAHVWIGKGAVVRIDRLIARSDSTKPVLAIEKGGEVRVGRCELQVPRDTPVTTGGGPDTRIELGPGCRT